MNQTFPTSRLIENLKLVSDSGPASLQLSFTEDRALTALQLLLAQKSHDLLPTFPMTLKAQERWGYTDPVPVMRVPTLEFSRAYTQNGTTSKEVNPLALKALKSLACKSFDLEWLTDGSKYIVNTALIDVSQYIMAGRVQPKYLRIALSPPLFQGIYPKLDNFVVKQSDLFSRIDQASGSGAGQRSEVPLRLIAWLTTLSSQGKDEMKTSETNLIHRLRLQALKENGLAKFRTAMNGHFLLVQKIGLIKSFEQPKANEEMWTLIRIPQKLKEKESPV